jgi:urease accessory protein
MFAATLPSEVLDHAPTMPPLAFERGDGAVCIRTRRRGARTVLAELYQRSPCRALFPGGGPGEPLPAVLLTTSGGLAGGDRLDIEIAAGVASHTQVTTQAAEKVYRSLGPDVAVSVRLDVGADAMLEWLPQETILFEHARFDRRSIADIAAGGRLLAADMVVFGRLARGERFSSGLWHESWRIRREGRLLWADAVRLEHDIAGAIDADSGFAGAEAMASAFYVGADAEPLAAIATGMLETQIVRAGCSRLGQLMIARWLGGAAAVRSELLRFLGGFRAAAGLAGPLPRLWYS